MSDVAYQFVHLESFSRKGDAKGRSTTFVLSEARRDPSASVHVPAPGTPVVVYGIGVDEVGRLHDESADAARTTPKGGKPRRIRQDQHTLMTVVASHPYTVEEVRTDPTRRAEADRWERLTVNWLREQFGDRLVSVIRHEDESHWHIHSYVLPDDPVMRASALHPGQLAKATIMSAGPDEGEDPKALNRRGDAAYKAAMRGWQNSYHEAVAIPCGLTRLGPARRRLTRAEWQREKTQARALRTTLDRAADVQQRVESFVRETKEGAKFFVARTKADATTLRVDADGAKAEADRRLALAKLATDAAKVAHDAAVAEQRKAKGMMVRVQQEASRQREASALLQRLSAMLRSVWDGFRVSKVQERLRGALGAEMEDLRRQATDAADRASKADEERRKAAEKARTLDGSLAETVAQRDAAWKELARLRPPEPEPAFAIRPRPKPGISR